MRNKIPTRFFIWPSQKISKLYVEKLMCYCVPTQFIVDSTTNKVYDHVAITNTGYIEFGKELGRLSGNAFIIWNKPYEQ